MWDRLSYENTGNAHIIHRGYFYLSKETVFKTCKRLKENKNQYESKDTNNNN
jgi:hypothetical protein